MAFVITPQPPGCSCDNLIGWGYTGSAYHDINRNEVVKAPNDPQSGRFIEIEKDIYERLCEDGQHEGLLEYRGSEVFDNNLTAIRLELAPCGQLDAFLKDNCNKFGRSLQMRWIAQLADVLKYVHSKGVVHGDIACHNILLDKDQNIKLIDFAGSSIDGSDLLITCSFRAQPPWPSTPQKADIFAFGSACYHIITRHLPFHEISDEDVEARYEQGNFPELTSLEPFEVIIERCWNSKYDSMDDVIRDLDTQCTFIQTAA